MTVIFNARMALAIIMKSNIHPGRTLSARMPNLGVRSALAATFARGNIEVAAVHGLAPIGDQVFGVRQVV